MTTRHADLLDPEEVGHFLLHLVPRPLGVLMSRMVVTANAVTSQQATPACTLFAADRG